MYSINPFLRRILICLSIVDILFPIESAICGALTPSVILITSKVRLTLSLNVFTPLLTPLLTPSFSLCGTSDCLNLIFSSNNTSN